MPKSIYPSVDEMTNLKTRDRKRKSKTLKTDSEKLEAIIEVIEKLDKLCSTKINDYNRSPEVEDFENAIYDMRKILGILWKD